MEWHVYSYGDPHNSKRYERILMKFSGNVQKGFLNNCLDFRVDGITCVQLGDLHNFKICEQILMKYLGNVQKGSLINGLDFAVDGMAHLEIVGSA